MATFTLKTNAIRVNTIIGTLFSDMTSVASQYTVPFGRIGGAVVHVLRQFKASIEKVVTIAVRVALIPINHVYKTNEWHERKEIKRTNRWVKTEGGKDERWQ